MKKTLLLANGGRWGDYSISYTTLGIHVVLFWWWMLPLCAVVFFFSRPFHYIGLAAETLWQKIRARRER